ncbi:MAG: hypothetical protein IT429_15640 [Gemmataceae bacterium]|nr:hypothetical protein [Gemmataceae bacterium]
MRIVFAGLCVAAAALLVGAGQNSQAGQKEKYSISDVMKQAHNKKTGLLKKIASGKGDKADAEKLLEMYIALAKNKPPQGDADSWKKFTDGLVAAAKVAVEGGKNAGKQLTKAANCGACHKVHKG